MLLRGDIWSNHFSLIFCIVLGQCILAVNGIRFHDLFKNLRLIHEKAREIATASSRPVIGGAPKSAKYLGCYKDSRDRLMKIKTPNGPHDMSADLCRGFCTDYRYFAMQYGKECFCANDFSRHLKKSKKCNMGCPGSSGICGGSWSLSLYEVDNPPAQRQCSGSDDILYFGQCQCTKCKNMKTETACEGKTLDLRCKKGMTIDIESAIYGRLSSKTCKAGSNIKTTNCASRKSTDKVKQKCNGHRNCNVRVSNWKMGGDPCIGVTKYLSVRYACVGPVIGGAPKSTKYLGCYKDSRDRLMKIKTPNGSHDMSADLCRGFCTDYRYFAMQYGKECFCANDFSRDLKESKKCNMGCPGSSGICGGSWSLSLYEVDNPPAQRQCSGSDDILYFGQCQCTKCKNMKTETACEGKTLDLRCKKGMTIDIESAIYGRLSSKTCKAGSNIKTTNCASRKSTDKVKQKCNGHRNCNVRVSNWKMGGDPCYGVTKYLSVRYACVGPVIGGAPKSTKYLGCYKDSRDRLMKIKTPNGPHDMSADLCRGFCTDYRYFAMQYGKECFCANDFSRDLKESKKCNMGCPGSSGICGGSWSLSLYEVDNPPAQRQCSGSDDILYFGQCQCTKCKNMKTETACEGKTLDLRCKKGMTIDIESAIYGRLSSKTCKAGSNIDTTNCASRKSTDKVKQKCNGHRNCNVRVSNWKMGGDPCIGVTKYLSVRYACVGPVIGEAPKSTKYLGCYKDSRDRLMKIRTPDGPNDMSADLCRGFCTDYRYFAMQYRKECFCANEFSRDLEESKKCNMGCPGSSGICGGSWSLSLYEVDNPPAQRQCSGPDDILYFGQCQCTLCKKCECMAWGDVHYELFDGGRRDFQGVCAYTMSKSKGEFPDVDCFFQLDVKNERRNSKPVSYTRRAKLKIGQTEILLKQNYHMEVDGIEFFEPVNLIDKGITITKEGSNLMVYSKKCSIAVEWDGRAKLTLIIPERFGPFVEGICGNCDGTVDPEILLDGTDVSGLSKYERHWELANQWEIYDDSEELEQCDVPQQFICTEKQKTLLAGNNYCGYLKSGRGSPFELCLTQFPEKSKIYYDDCEFDICSNLGTANEEYAKCRAIEGFVTFCNSKDIRDLEWRTSTFCPHKCNDNEQYNEGEFCEATCSDPGKCVQQAAGCQCEQGYLRDNQHCVHQSTCGCTTDDGFYFPIGKKRYWDDCTKIEECREGGKMVPIMEHAEGCHENAMCEPKDGAYKCKCKTGYRGDGINKCKEIHPACIKTVQVRCIRSRGRKGKLCKVKNAEMIRSVQLMYSHGNHRNNRNRGQPKCILNVNLFLSKKGNKFVIKRRCSGTFRVTYEGKGDNCDSKCGINAEEVNGHCRCPDGYTGNPKIECTDTCTCVSSGDPHINTYDSAMIHFMGICTYTLSKHTNDNDACFFNVETTLERRNDRQVSYNREVHVDYGTGTIYSILQGGVVMVNGMGPVSLPQYQLENGNVEITVTGNFVTIRHIPCEIEVMFDGRHMAVVNVPFAGFSSLVTGLCGNCNGNKRDDYSTKEGELVGKQRKHHHQIGNSYKVELGTDPSCKDAPELPKCSRDRKKKAASKQFCGLLKKRRGPFKNAFDVKKLNFEGLFESCVFDVCLLPDDTDIHCQTLEETVYLANQYQITIDPIWREITNCPFEECDAANGFVYSATATCTNTCMEPNADQNCNIFPHEACVCEDGKVLKDGICVLPEKCTEECVTDMGITVNEGEIFPADAECGPVQKCSRVDGSLVLVDENKMCQGALRKCLDASCICLLPTFPSNGETDSDCLHFNQRKKKRKGRKKGQSENECLCSAHGDPHYGLFGGQYIDFMGECRYIFSKTKDILDGDVCQYHVEVFNYKKDENKRATYTKGVIVEFGYFQESFRFEQGQPIKRNDFTKVFTGSSFADDRIELRNEGRYKYVVALHECNITLRFDGEHSIELIIPKHMGDNVTGLCAECGNDRLMTPDGEDLSSDVELRGQAKKLRDKKYGDSWLSDDADDTKCSHTPTTPECPDDIKEKLSSELYCGQLNKDNERSPFHQCIIANPGFAEVADTEFNGCITDVCGDFESNDIHKFNKIRCDAIEGLDSMCTTEEDHVHWRTRHFCYITCPETSEYTTEKNYCEPTCANPTLDTDPDCLIEKEQINMGEGCECKNTFYRSGDDCVPINECGCTLENGEYMPLGHQIVLPNCMVMECQHVGGQSQMVEVEGETKRCGQNQQCEMGDDGIRCVCVENFMKVGKKCKEITESCKKETTVTCNGKFSRRCDVPGAKLFYEVNLVKEISNGKCEAKKGYRISRNGKKFIVRRKCKGEFHVKYLSEDCDVDGKWSDWSEPSKCSVTCGGGVQTIERSCNNPAPLHGGKPCEGEKTQKQKCNEQACPVDGIWSDWSEASECSVTCGGGVQKMERSCNNPAPLHGGKPCEGDKTQTQKCNEQACPEECVCATYGDPHIKTYDGLAMKFQGICRYTLSKSVAPVCPFNVEVQHERRYGKPKVSYNKYLVFEIYGKSFRMEKNYKLMMDDEFITVLGYMLDGRIFISYLPGGLLAIEAVECGVKVMWDGRHMGVVAVPRPDHLGHLSGMCGDCDRNKDNDLTTKDGQNVAHLGNKAYTLVGDSYVVLTSSGEPIGCPQIKTPPTPKCPDSMAAEKKCAILKKDNAGSPFKACMDKYDAEVKFDDMFDACVFDACESGNSAELLCDSFEFAENECEKNTETVHWRTENFCPMHCQGDMEFKDEVACIPSCEERQCNEAPRPGCTCPEGTVLLDAQSGTCVPRDKCEYCQNADGVKVMLNDTLNKGNCKATKRCVPNDPLPQLQDKAAVPCQQSEVCEPDGSMVYSCRDCSTKECAKNAECYIDAQNQMRKCRCMDGYSGKAETGFECFKPTTTPPTTTTTPEPHSNSYCEPCHENAKCKPIYPGSSDSSCQCTYPFIGDGVSYCEPVSTPMTPALPPPPVDGIWSDWSEASECSVTCGGGVQTMERSCNNPAPLHGGKPCEGNKTQTQKCNEQACPVDGIWSDWSEASECSVTCGGGVQTMERSCNNPAPLHGGKPCEGDKTQKQKCNERACPVDGIWSDWSEASECSVTCGGGVQTMERSCNNPAPLHGGKPCEGDKTQKQKCNERACPVDGIWSDWSEASECSVTCGGGVQKMERSCNNPAPLHGGKPCEGDKAQKQKCNEQACPVDGIWSDWSEASECSVTCGGGVQTMERSCNNPAPLHGGKPCEGDKTQKQKCNERACPVDGIWSDWSEASECSVTCGGGVQTMERSCNNPAPLHGGKPCEGDKTQKQKCNERACPVDGIWSDWSEASECSVTCGGGVQTMERSCNNPAPLHGGKPCEGDKTQKQKCNERACPEECVCATYGDPHIKTYDGLAMKFQGICRYTLSKSVAPVCPFNVEVQHERRYGKPKVSYNKYLIFEIYGKSFRMEKNYKLMMDDEFITVLGYMLDGRIFISYLPGGLLAIEAVECGVKVMWDGRHMGVVAVPRPDHLGHLSGMCGDCDRNKDNDLTTKDGQNVAHLGNKAYTLVGDSYVVLTSSGEPIGCPQIKTPPTPKCPDSMAAEKKCAMLKKDNAGSPFKACMDKYDAEVKFDDMFDACVFDACESGNSAELLCDSFEFAENECEKNTETVHWRTENFCPMHCQGDMEFKDEVACIPSCEERQCNEAPRPGCTCPEGTVLLDAQSGTCVPRNKCEYCQNADGVKVMLNDTLNKGNCKATKRCVPNDPLPQLQDKAAVPCQQSEVCEPDGSMVYSCRDCSTKECAKNAECYIDAQNQMRKCRCMDGYSGKAETGFECFKPTTTPPTTTTTPEPHSNSYCEPCHENAKCKPIYPGSSDSSCQCTYPFIGDGVSYCEPEKTTPEVEKEVTTQPLPEPTEPIISAPEPTPEGYCMCSAIGVNQYILNDGKVIGNMNEKCKYSADLTKHKDNSNEDCFFEVIVHNTFKKRFGLFSAVDSVEIQVNHLRVNLYQGSIAKVNGATVDLPFKQNNIYIVKSGGRLRMSSPCGLMVLFGGGQTTGSTVDVFVQKTLVTPLSGICGLCGTDMNIPDPVQYISTFSKKDKNKCVRVGMKCPIRAGSGLCRDFTVNRIPPYKKPQVCSSSPFCDCFESSDLYAKMFEICAMYACLDTGMVCDISQSFMDRCRFNNKGYRYWKTSASYTPMCRKPECSKANMEYKDDTIACPATCTDRNPEASCMLPQISGCVCIENHVLSEGECIPISQCGGTVDEPIDGIWSDWSEASECSVTCGGGVQKMERSCNNPAPLHGGRPCEGDSQQTQKCNEQACSVDGNWSDWSEPSECSVTCGGGVQTMERSCNNPAPLHGGKPCEGDKTQKQKCNERACPVDGKWSDWSEPSECSVPCRGGVQIMERSCNNPAPLHGGKPCEGDKTQTQKCNEQACPGDCESNNECDVNGFCDDGKCKCKENYEGNGYDNCKQICVDSDCAKNAACKKGACKCNTGFVGNGNTLCKIKCGRKKCHENAICKKKKCVCKNKFPYGDGVKRCSDTCNGKICVKNAECPRNKCKCKRRYYQILDEAGEMIECRKMCGRNKCHRYASCEKRQCVCNPGYIGDGKLCHESCMCSAFGDPHVLRYSQSLVSFAGQCKYTLSRFLEIGDPCMFDVQVNYYKGKKTSDGAAMVEYVLLEMYGMVIQLGPHRQVMVDNQKVSLPFFSKNKDLSIRYMGFNMIVETKCFVKLQFNEAGVVILTIAKMYGDNVEGLCGACNGLKEWKIKGGDDVPDAASDKFSRIAQSFAVLEAGAVCKTTEINACKAKDKRKAKSRRNCGTILNKIRHKQFKKCAAAYPGLVEMIKQTCYLDYCTNVKDKPSLKGVVCTSLETIIALCHYNGYGGIRWRSRRLCGKKCKRNERYKFKTIACPNNCVERRASRSCRVPKIEDCECKRGYVKSGDECVKYKRRKYPNCGCKKNGRYIKLDHSLISEDCSSEKTCTAKKNKPAKLKETSLQCHREAYCGVQKGIRSCMCLSDFIGDGINTCTPIDPAAEPSDGNSTQGICDLQENIIHCVKTVSMKGNCFYQSKYKDECKYHVAMSQNHHGDDTVIYSVNRNDGISRKRLLRGSKTDDCGNVEYDSSGYVKITEKVCDCPTDHVDN